MSTPDGGERFESVDWDEIEGGTRLSPERLTLLVGAAILTPLYWYDTRIAHVYLVADLEVTLLDWVFVAAVLVLVAYGLIPALRRRDALRRVLGHLRARPSTLFASLFLAGLAAAGLVLPALLPSPGLQFGYDYQPPVGFTTPITPHQCYGEVVGPEFEWECQGSWGYPLGTNHRGHPMSWLVVEGARTTVYVLLITAAFVMPLAVGVGVIAGLRGGLVDDLLMSYVDFQLAIPAIVVYFIGYAYWNPSILLLLAAFGLFSWGGIARLVRSETLQRREDGHVLVARSLGASRRYVARRHVLPNVTNTIVPAVFHLLALLVLVEAGVAFLGFHQIDVYSWGSTISEGLNARVPTQMQTRADHPAYRIWWVSTFPALALTLTMLSLKLVGDGLRDALDPRGER